LARQLRQRQYKLGRIDRSLINALRDDDHRFLHRSALAASSIATRVG
jgi:hypothetical protein